MLVVRKLEALFLFRIHSRREQLAGFSIEENGCCLSWFGMNDRLDTVTNQGSSESTRADGEGVLVRADGEGVNVGEFLSPSDGAVDEGLGRQILLFSA